LIFTFDSIQTFINFTRVFFFSLNNRLSPIHSFFHALFVCRTETGLEFLFHMPPSSGNEQQQQTRRWQTQSHFIHVAHRVGY